jgi:hypothetical protein
VTESRPESRGGRAKKQLALLALIMFIGLANDGCPVLRFSSQAANLAFGCVLLALPVFAPVLVLRLVPRTIDFETMEWHHYACAPKIPFDSHLKTDRCLRPEFALATAEPTRRVEPGWC